MVVTPRRRRLIRFVVIVFLVAGAVLLYQHANFHFKNVGGRGSRLARAKPRERHIHNPKENALNPLPKSVHLQPNEAGHPSRSSKQMNVTWIRHPWTTALKGHLNVHVFLDWCGTTVDDLRRNIHFPKYPDVRLKASVFHLVHDSHNFGQRVFGFLHPPKTGLYTFAISSDDCSELWLSTDRNPTNARLIAQVGNLTDLPWQDFTGDGQFTKYRSQISKAIFLQRGERYFVEALHKQSTSNDHLLVAWKMPRVQNFSHITRGRISQYLHPHIQHTLDVTKYARHIPLTPATLRSSKYPKHIETAFDASKLRSSIPRSPARYIVSSLNHPKCSYSPSYLVDFNVSRYEGVYLVHETAVYPDDWSHLDHVERYKPCVLGRVVDSHGKRLPDAPIGDDEAEDEEMDLPTVLTTMLTEQDRVVVEDDVVPEIPTDRKRRSVFGKDSEDGTKFKKRRILAAFANGESDDSRSVGQGYRKTAHVVKTDSTVSRSSKNAVDDAVGNVPASKGKDIMRLQVGEGVPDHIGPKGHRNASLKEHGSLPVKERYWNNQNKLNSKARKGLVQNQRVEKDEGKVPPALVGSKILKSSKDHDAVSEKLSDKASTVTSSLPSTNLLNGPLSNGKEGFGARKKDGYIRKGSQSMYGLVKTAEVEGVKTGLKNLGNVEMVSRVAHSEHRRLGKNGKGDKEEHEVKRDRIGLVRARQVVSARNSVANVNMLGRNVDNSLDTHKQSYVGNRVGDPDTGTAVGGLKIRYGERVAGVGGDDQRLRNENANHRGRFEQSDTGDSDGNQGMRTAGGDLKSRYEQRDATTTRDDVGNKRLKRVNGNLRSRFEQRDTGDSNGSQGVEEAGGSLRRSYEHRDAGDSSNNQLLKRANVDAKRTYAQPDTEDNDANQGFQRKLRNRRIKLGHSEEAVQNSRNALNRKKKRMWRRAHGDDIMFSASPKAAATLARLKETGVWEAIKAYAKEKGLLFTKRTWMYVTWKYFHYEKPRRPHDKIAEYIYKQSFAQCRTDGNKLLNEDVAKGIVLKYLKDLRKSHSRDVQLKRIVNVEENHDVFKGDRYLIELDVQLNGQNETLRVSEYVYLPVGQESFCSPQDFAWRRNATVHVIVPVKDQGKWVQHFIDDMSELYQETLDPNVNVVIVDFNSTDINIEEALSRSALKRYQLVKVNGSFQRALGVQIGADAVKNPDDILFTCDLHLEIPNSMIEIIRKHCVQGKMAFSPMVLRLDCGFTPSMPFGEWETLGFGLFAIYKSDFDRIGGMNHEEFKTKWGGEDWEMVDRFLQHGMEIERLRVPGFYHFFHSKQGMWGTYGFEDNVSNNGERLAEDQLVPFYDPDKDRASRYYYNQPLLPAF